MIMRKKAGRIIGGLPFILAYGQLGTAAAASHQFVFQLQWAVMFEFRSKQVNLEDLGCNQVQWPHRLEQQLEEMSATDYDTFLVEVNQKVSSQSQILGLTAVPRRTGPDSELLYDS
jgi:hypothetical protein